MPKQLRVTSRFPNLAGLYAEQGASEGRPVYARQSGDAIGMCIVFSTKFGTGPRWYFAKAPPQAGGSFNSFCCSEGDAASPEEAAWPAGDIDSVRDARVSVANDMDDDVDMDVSASLGQKQCDACRDLAEICAGLQCSACGPAAAVPASSGLALLRGLASSAILKQLALGLAGGDAVATQTLERVFERHQCRDMGPVIILHPHSSIQVGENTATLTCEAVCVTGSSVKYQWRKDGMPLPRAERPRYMLCGAGPSDEGLYDCEVSAGAKSERSQPCEVRLLADVESKRVLSERPLQQAAEAQARGDLAAAAAFFGEAAAFGQTEGARADALSKSASLLLQLGRWADAFRDASDAVKLSPGLVAAHVIRGRAATELGQLAEAVSSWETAELLGGVPEAAQQAEACRQRLQQFFTEQQEKRRASGAHAGTGGFADKPNSGDDPEASWQRNGWHGRYAGDASGGFFGSGNRGSKGAGSRNKHQSFLPQRSPELQRHLGILGINADASEPLPSADTVRTAYRRLALQAHPDKPGGSKVAFQELQNAYEAVLNAIAV
mmetsp:Transcript_81257/g.161231  ORF Transcript_81257/g.161231 Transcript_81257/m.161231 type:complete len:551 (+) Transcript_81257:88-1740(+)